MTDRRLEDEAQRGEWAKELLSNTMLQAAFLDLRKQYFEAFVAADGKDDLGRFRLQQACVVLEKVERHLRDIIQNGSLAKEEIDILRRGGERKRFGIV